MSLLFLIGVMKNEDIFERDLSSIENGFIDLKLIGQHFSYEKILRAIAIDSGPTNICTFKQGMIAAIGKAQFEKAALHRLKAALKFQGSFLKQQQISGVILKL